MGLITYLTLFTAVFTIANLFLTFLVEAWRDWQVKQVQKVAQGLDDSFIFLEKKKLFLFTLSPFIAGGIGFLLLKNIFGMGAGFVIGLAIPNLMTKMAKQARIKKFQGQLVDTLIILSSSLKGGLSFVQALEVVCEEMPAPVAEEFGLVLKENKLGVTLDESLENLRKRLSLEEVNLLVSSILVAKATGGELTRVFSQLVETIRNNLKLKEKLTTLTLQGKLQGIIMACLPIAFTFFIHRQNPEHFKVMLETQLGKMMLAGAVLAQIIGMYLIKKVSTLNI